MKFYKHYKNKPYKFHGIAKHSETLEELVVYETRYESPQGKMWVRPKDMFFESVTVDGAVTPRFKKMPLTIAEAVEVKEDEIKFIATIMEKAFGEWDERWFFSTFKNHQKYYLLMASIEEVPVGFKLGYELNDREFYSWLGGVVPEYRGIGIAADLMTKQHEWCREKGYQQIQTTTQNRFREMLLLNIRFGFDVVGITDSDEQGSKIILQKKIV